MASQTIFECDGCLRSIPDPGTIVEIEIREYSLENGHRTYIAGVRYEEASLELCPSCGQDIRRAVSRVLTTKKES